MLDLASAQGAKGATVSDTGDAVDEETTAGRDTDRRDFLKKTLVAGTAIWTAPVVTTLPGGRAWAQTYGVCNCDADAFGLLVSIPTLGINQTLGVDGCVANVALGNNSVAAVSATTVCGAAFSTVGGGCSAEASIASLTVRTGPTATPTLKVEARVLLTTASATCAPCTTTGDFSALAVRVSGSLIGSPINVNVGTACNLVLGSGLVIVNEQFCAGSTLNVNALHINVPGVLTVIASHAAAGATGCPCTTC
jgi:hypothetical protein